MDKVQLYLGPSSPAARSIAFAGMGAASTEQALRLERVRYERIGQDVCVIGYPIYDPVVPNNSQATLRLTYVLSVSIINVNED